SLGTVTFAEGGKDDVFKSLYKVDEKVADRLVGQALDAGINFFDTSDAYANGASERMLGQVLRARRNEVVIATKIGARCFGVNTLIQAGLTRRHIMWG